MFSSPLMSGEYMRSLPNYEGYVKRRIVASQQPDQDVSSQQRSPAENAGIINLKTALTDI
jgi:hypothetical protein